MNICMIVHNSATRDGRVMREAHALRAAGHAVNVVGIPEPKATAPVERLDDGVIVHRVQWHPEARRRLIVSAVPRGAFFVAMVAAIAYGAYRLLRWLIALARFYPHSAWSVVLGVALICLLTIATIAFVLARAIARRRGRRDAVRRQMISGAVESGAREFPAIRSRIPDWLPDWLLEIAVEPLDWFGAKTGRFSMYRYRSEALAAAAAALKPDVVHCHDCAALPTGWLVKRNLGIPLVYDAHEIYEAVAARRFGATDYFARIHRKYLRNVDAMIAVNDSAAAYYRLAYPEAPRAVVIRNATDGAPRQHYEGQLHDAADLPRQEKILLYQGGFTKHRGLAVLVRAAPLLPAGWSLVMMGWGPLLDELKEIAADQSAKGRTKARFIPAVPPAELLTWTQGASAGIVPYEDKMLNHWIATPNKLWEYPNAGVPMIVQPFPEMARIVETYGCGWVLPKEFSASAIAALVASLTDASLAAARLGCRKFVENDNWFSTYRPRLLALYEDLASRFAANSPPPAAPSSCGLP